MLHFSEVYMTDMKTIGAIFNYGSSSIFFAVKSYFSSIELFCNDARDFPSSALLALLLVPSEMAFLGKFELSLVD